LTYSLGTDALLSATTGNFTLTNVRITGTHSGWAGNGNKFFSLTSFNAAAPITVPLTLTNVTVDITGQGNGFDGTNGGSAFLHSWNNNGPVSITDSIFDESGFASTLNLLGTGVTPSGSYTITNNLFNRNNTPANRTVRPEGNRLENVNAVLSSNTFSQGSYLDLYGTISGITIGAAATTNTFNTITDPNTSVPGYGIRITAPNNPASTKNLLGTTVFTGPGLPLKYVNATANTSYTLTGGTITVNGTAFTNLIAGGQGTDTISGTANADWINGDDGADSISGGVGIDFILGGEGNDTIDGGGDVDTINGGGGDDRITGGLGNDVINAGAGNNVITDGGIGADDITHDAASSTLTINLTGTSTASLSATAAGVTVNSAAGVATKINSSGSTAAISFNGNTGADILTGGSSNDTISGGGGNDTINGNPGNDTIFGGDGNDSINGGTGSDSLDGGLGNDTLVGSIGTGVDNFYFTTALNASTNLDTITDFKNGGSVAEKIYLSNIIFTGLTVGTLLATDFGTLPAVGADVVASGGGLYFAAGGAATLAGYTQFATLTSPPTIGHTDFVVF
jgi:Ca2+-binding RTX toxin-like protein